ncbi:hypothetical protein C8N38_13116 [Rhodovulum kholense]|uniref:Uncharacterized protein n=2 Tax=Rhodovulum kholense TaxID=453584 RepID=A0A8E2VG34_9RHOB|nr:hypothetical protein C8N38_13116 [Rhodovulum kholense]
MFYELFLCCPATEFFNSIGGDLPFAAHRMNDGDAQRQMGAGLPKSRPTTMDVGF